MTNYLIGVGGTGAKCIESIVHLSAAGLLGQNKCKVFFVDLDSSNGSLGRSLTTLQNYLNCRLMNIGGTDAFSADLTPYENRVWNPLPDAASRSLRAYYSYDDPAERNHNSARLIEALFAPEHIDLPLNEGFRGVTSVGAAIMAGTVDLTSEEPWAELFEDLQHAAANTGGANVMLIGSVFGGTGASGIPTIGRLIATHLKKADIQNVRLGATLLLPYFSFGSVEGEQVQADASKFLPSTQAALDYYNERRYLKVFTGGVYLIGENNVATVAVPSVGGRDQENDPHPTELFAALACLDFCLNTEGNGQCMLVARNKPDLIVWADLPAPAHFDLRSQFGQFFRFCYFYLAACHAPILEYVRSRTVQKTPWINNFLKNSDNSFQEIGKNAEHMRAYCESFLVWIGAMHLQSRTAQLQLGLIYPDSIVETVTDPPRVVLKQHLKPSFKDILLPVSAKEGLSFQGLWDELMDAKPNNPLANQGFPQFVTKLYQLCAVN